MIRRVLIAACAVTLVLPAVGSAQLMTLQDDPSWQPRVRITPFVGYLTSSGRTDEWITSDGSTIRQEQVEFDLGGGPAVGLAVAMRLAGNWGITAAGGYGMRDAFMFAPSSGPALRQDGDNNVFFARLGPNLLLLEPVTELQVRRLNAAVHAGAVIMHERPRNADFSALVGNATHFGINLGAEAELPFASDRFAVQVAIEDNIMWWDETQMGNLAFAYFDDGLGTYTRGRTTASTEFGQAWLIRGGISIRLR